MVVEEERTNEDPGITRGREAVERSLRQQVFVEHFPLQTAGAPVSRRGPSAYTRTFAGLPQGNPYTPFSSKMDWEVARWVKLRGPSSTAVTELLSIPGVSFRSSNLMLRLN